LRVGALDHVVEVSDGLVRVNDERQLKFAQRELRTAAGVPIQITGNAESDQSAESNRLHRRVVAYPFDSRGGVWNAGTRELMRETAAGAGFHRS
jgi:hypothetical protein